MRRLAFVYEEDEDGNIDSVPVTLIRSQADALKHRGDTLFANIDYNVLENLAKIMEYLTVGGHHGKKEKKRERMELLKQIWDNKTSNAPLGSAQLRQKGDKGGGEDGDTAAK